MSSNNQPLVSVVTPVYNGAKYLPECIESVLAQTYSHWDYTILDNCSTDATEEIAQRYAAADRRIRVVRNEGHLRAIANHNAALRLISNASTYCKVVFADDWIFPECLERMVGLAQEHPSVGVVSAYAVMGDEVLCTGLPRESRVVAGREICRRHLLEKQYLFGSANTLLYRADLVRCHDPFFNEANIHADTEACFELLKDCDFGLVHQVLTFTRVRPASLTSYSQRLETGYAGMLRVLVNHGRNYLGPDELDAAVAAHLSDYYRFLGRSVLRPMGREVLEYHRGQLAELGFGFAWGRLVLSALGGLLMAGLSPRKTMETLRHLGQPEGVGGPGSEAQVVSEVPVARPPAESTP